MKLCPGKSVGAIIKDDKGHFLCLYRLKKLIGLAFPAGHIDDNESEEVALWREVFEETGLVVSKMKLILHQAFPNPCSRGDYDGHEWFVYLVEQWEGAPRRKEEDKHAFVRFLSWKEIEGYIKRKDYDPAWFNYILPALALKAI